MSTATDWMGILPGTDSVEVAPAGSKPDAIVIDARGPIRAIVTGEGQRDLAYFLKGNESQTVIVNRVGGLPDLVVMTKEKWLELRGTGR